MPLAIVVDSRADAAVEPALSQGTLKTAGCQTWMERRLDTCEAEANAQVRQLFDQLGEDVRGRRVHIGDRPGVHEHLLDMGILVARKRSDDPSEVRGVCEEQLAVEAQDHQPGELLVLGMSTDIPEPICLVGLGSAGGTAEHRRRRSVATLDEREQGQDHREQEILQRAEHQHAEQACDR